jgi:hypothetical protein
MKNMQQKIQLTGNPANFSGCKSEMNRSDGLPERLEFYRRIQRTFPSVAPFHRCGRLRLGHSKRFERSFIERLERSAALEPLERLKPEPRRFERSAAVERFERFEPRLGSHLREICSKILFLSRWYWHSRNSTAHARDTSV